MAGHDVVIHLASNPDIARAATEPTIDFWQGTALTQSVVEAMRDDQRQADPVRVGQRRVRRSRHARGRRGPRAARPGVDLRRQQAGGRGADRQLRGDVRPVGLRLPLRQRGRPAPDPRRGLRLRARAAARGRGGRAADLAAHPGRRQPVEVVHPRRRRGARRADRARRRRPRRSRPTTSRRATTSPSARSPSWRSPCVGLAPGSVRFAYTGGDRGWKGDVPVVRLDTRADPGARLALRAPARARRCAQSIAAMIPDMQAGRM